MGLNRLKEIIIAKTKNDKTIFVGLSLLLSLLIIYYLQWKSNWYVFRITGRQGIHASPNFKDLHTVLYNVECFKTSGLDIFQLHPTERCQGGYIYGYLLVFLFSVLGFGANDTNHIAIVLTCALITLISVFALKLLLKNLGDFVTMLICISNPSFWFLAERGNLDLLMAIILLAASILLIDNHEKFGISLIVITVLFKFYTLPLLLILPFVLRKKSNKIISLALIPVLITITIWNLHLIKAGFISTWYVSFGLPIFGNWIELGLRHANIEISKYLIYFLGYLIGALLSVGILLMFRKFVPEKRTLIAYEKVTQAHRISIAILGSTFLITFVSGVNFDYRLIFLSLAAYSIYTVTHVSYRKIIVLLLFFALWFNTIGFGLPFFAQTAIQLLGDVALLIVSVWIVQILILLYEPEVSQYYDAFKKRN